MKIKSITLQNFRIYKGVNEISFDLESGKNINLIAGKNGYGKTTFLTSLVWGFYGRLMAQVEDKFRLDIKNSGGYDEYLNQLFNSKAKYEYVEGFNEESECFVQIELNDISIPSIPCSTVTIKRSFNLATNEENLSLLIDGDENELTKEVGYEVFINDFILPREIAKFFFFDAEKIVSLAEAKTTPELRSLSRAYSEVLGIKKYEDLKKNIEILITRLRRSGVSKEQKKQLDKYILQEEELLKLEDFNKNKKSQLESRITELKLQSDALQEKLIREGNSITLEELKELKDEKQRLKKHSEAIKSEFKKTLDLAPLIIAGKKLVNLYQLAVKEHEISSSFIDSSSLQKELKAYSKKVLKDLEDLDLNDTARERIINKLKERIEEQVNEKSELSKSDIILEFSEERFREFQSTYHNLNTSYLEKFNRLVKDNKDTTILLNSVTRKIKKAEARKNNDLAKKHRNDKEKADEEIRLKSIEREDVIAELGALGNQISSARKLRSEYEKNFNLAETNIKKYEVSQKLLEKINKTILRIKEDKKFSLKKSIMLNLERLMHKKNFISSVKINIHADIMDIDLIDTKGEVISKDLLSKGEQQLYASALLKALVDESGIKFPVFIDSPLQKFDKFHSQNIINEFYPTISDQVVLLPLLEKELSENEFDLLKDNLENTYLIENRNGNSTFRKVKKGNLFKEFKENELHTYQD